MCMCFLRAEMLFLQRFMMILWHSSVVMISVLSSDSVYGF